MAAMNYFNKLSIYLSILVFIAEDNVVRNRWPLGRVVEVFTGRDGCVRSARIKTAGGVFHRRITKICLLEEANDT